MTQVTPALQCERVDILGPIATFVTTPRIDAWPARCRRSPSFVAPGHDTLGERCHGPDQEVQHILERAPTQTPATTQVAAPHDKEKVPLTSAQIVRREAEKTIPLQEGHAVNVQG